MENAMSITILIVDDDAGHRELVRRNLKRSGLINPILTLSEGQEALDFVFRRGVHANRAEAELLILLDINMPGINGVEVLRQIKEDPEKRKIPILMLTTTDDPREVARCYELGCNVYVTKPVDPGEFMEAVNRIGLFLSIVKVPEES
jgi:CheY-like chemotaxis protein